MRTVNDPAYDRDAEAEAPDVTRESLLERVWTEVREAVIQQVDVIDRAALALLTPGATVEPADAATMAHRLAGSLGSFGIVAVSQDARELESLFERLTTSEPDQVTTLRIADLAVRLREHVAQIDRVFAPLPVPAFGEPDTSDTLISLPEGVEGMPVPVVDVAVVEDDPVIADLVVRALGQHGISTCVLSDGAAAADALAGFPPSVDARVVLLDVDLPSLNGLDLLRRLQGTGTLERTKVIMLTARCGEAETIEAFDLGAIDHVAKPFSHPVLVRRVKLALGR